MSHSTPDPNDEHGSVYDGLLGTDTSQWAFGTDFEDPLAGVDTTVPDDLDPAELAAYCLALGDDALVLSNRLSEWCSNAPDLEDDIALANIALDLLGQARLLLARAAAADPSIVPACPRGRRCRSRTRSRSSARRSTSATSGWSRSRTATSGRRSRGCCCSRPCGSRRSSGWSSTRDPVLAAIAAKGVKELTYHRDYAGRWFLTLAQGTEESRRRLTDGLTALWPLYDEFRTAYDAGPDVDVVLDQVFAISGVERPEVAPMAGHGHTEALSRMLAEMQVVARAHPMGLW